MRAVILPNQWISGANSRNQRLVAGCHSFAADTKQQNRRQSQFLAADLLCLHIRAPGFPRRFEECSRRKKKFDSPIQRLWRGATPMSSERPEHTARGGELPAFA